MDTFSSLRIVADSGYRYIREIYNEERGVLDEETRKIDECDMEKFDTLLR